MALAFQRTAAINRETIAALADLVTPEVAAEVDRAYREVAYGDMGVEGRETTRHHRAHRAQGGREFLERVIAGHVLRFEMDLGGKSKLCAKYT